MEYIRINENGIHIVFGVTEDRRFKLLHFSSAEFKESDLITVRTEMKEDEKARTDINDEVFQLVQFKASGFNSPYEKHGNKHILSAPGCFFRYVGMTDERNGSGRLLTITEEDAELTGIRVVTTMQFYDGISVVRIKNNVINNGRETVTLEDVSSFLYFGIDKEGEKLPEDKMHLIVPQNGWQKEYTIKDCGFTELGLTFTQPGLFPRSSLVFEVTNTGHWSTKKYLPIGYIGNREADTALFFQIEHNGSWHYEVSDQNGHYYVYVSGPNETQSHWFKELAPGESFETVPVAVGVSDDSAEHMIRELTKYRRKIRRPNRDDEELPVIFNDYMNCLFGDPTTEKELPLIDAAAQTGCEYFVIDAGWYDKGFWWDSVGEWKESRERFPNGIREVTDYIRKKGMIPGCWLELEVMGTECEKAKRVPDDWFFVRHGKRVCDRSRYQLDFRNPEVIKHADEVIDRVVKEYGAGYIKMDYNIEPGIGTELLADSPGDGLLQHERAYLSWLSGVFERYPDLVIENCSSGGLRMDYAMLSRYSIQSTSDQEDYREYATISANVQLGVCPEQAAVWSYPVNRKSAEPEEVIYNMVNALLLRIHQSGHLAELPKESVALVKDGLSVYRSIRGDIKNATVFLPNGFADNRDKWLCSGLQLDDSAYLCVWKREMKGKLDNRRLLTREEREDENAFSIPLSSLPFGGTGKTVEQIYPSEKMYDLNDALYEGLKAPYTCKDDILTVRFEQPVMARLYRIREK
ncbi:MAG: alpha-galactosidase [Lachnospiraceae bacterium]|nr:alpha-galactosidase [Lachnospiraceae bacterium]